MFFELLHTFSPTVLYTMHFDNSAAYERKTEDKAARHTVYPQKNCTTKFLAEHWQKLGQILTVFHHWKRTKFSTKLLQYLYSHLKHVATLPYETQNAKLPQITNKEVAKL